MDATKRWLSVLVPVHGVEDHLQACVASVLSQADDGVEVLLLDDGSPDRSGDIAQALCERHPRQVRLIRHERNRGLSVARNTLLAHASGDYAWHFDADDVMLPGAIPRLREVVDGLSPDLVLCDFRIVRERFGLKHRLRGELHRKSFDGQANRLDHDRARLAMGLMRMRRMHVWTKIARREAWARVRFPEGRGLMQDVAVMPGLIDSVRSFVYVAEPWVGYRQHRDSTLAKHGLGKSGHALQSLRELKSGMSSFCGRDAEARFAVDYFCLRVVDGIARKRMRQGRAAGNGVDAACRDAIPQLFPEGIAPTLDACRARGWHLRAWRLRQNLRRLQWI